MKHPVTMRAVFTALVRELGPVDGPGVFVWYCTTYNVTITDTAPATVAREVFGI